MRIAAIALALVVVGVAVLYFLDWALRRGWGRGASTGGTPSPDVWSYDALSGDSSSDPASSGDHGGSWSGGGGDFHGGGASGRW